MNHDKLRIVVEGQRAWTSGLERLGHNELRAEVNSPELIGECELFLQHVSNYIQTQNARIRPGETLPYGYWLTKFVVGADGVLDLWEYNQQATEFISGVSLTLTYWRDQHEVCSRYGAAFAPPRPDKLVVVSAGVVEGEPIDGVRYPSPEHMSGWWLTTARYSGDISALQHEHLYHVTAVRPELARYVALPYGFCIRVGEQERVWFDRDVASSPSE